MADNQETLSSGHVRPRTFTPSETGYYETPNYIAPEATEPKETDDRPIWERFSEFNQEVMRGRPMFSGAESLGGKIAQGFGNILSDFIYKPWVGAPVEIGKTVWDIPKLPGLLSEEKHKQQLYQAQANASDIFLKRIRSMDPMQREHVRNWLGGQLDSQLPDRWKDTALDKNTRQALGEAGYAAVGALQALSMGAGGMGKYMDALSASKWSTIFGSQSKAIGIGGGLASGAAGPAATTVGGALGRVAGLNAAEWATWSMAEQLTNSEDYEKGWGDMLEEAALEGAIGAIPGTMLDIGLSKGVNKLFRGSWGAAYDNAARGLRKAVSEAFEDEAIEALPGFKVQKLVPGKSTKIRKVITADDIVSGRVKNPSHDFSGVQRGDVVAVRDTRGGLQYYRVQNFQNTTDLTDPRAQAAFLTDYLEKLKGYRQNVKDELAKLLRIEGDIMLTDLAGESSLSRALGRMINDFTLKDAAAAREIDKLSGTLNQAYVDSLKKADPFTADKKWFVDLKDRNGTIRRVTLDELKGNANIVARRIEVPTEQAVKAMDPATRRKAQAAGAEHVQSDRSGLFVMAEDESGRMVKVPYYPGDIPEGQSALSDILRRLGHKLAEPDFKAGRASRAVSAVMGPEGMLRKSGISMRFIERHRRRLDSEMGERLTRFRNMAKASIEEGKAMGMDIKETSRLMFRAANTPNFDMRQLSPAMRAQIKEWKVQADDLLTRVNRILVSMGKEPVQGREAYISNLITDTAKMFMALDKGRAMPEDIIGLMGKDMANWVRRLSPEKLNPLLERRLGGLPIEEDFFKAAQVAYQQHLGFIHMQPVVATMEMLTKLANRKIGNQFSTNIKLLEDYHARIAGTKESGNKMMRDLDNWIKETIVKERLFDAGGAEAGIRNPLRALSKEVPLQVHGRDLKVRLPKEAVNTLIDHFGPGNWARGSMKLSYWANLSMNPAYAMLNLLQPYALAVPRLRGSMLERWSDMMKGTQKAYSMFFAKGYDEMSKEMERLGLLKGAQEIIEQEMGFRWGSNEIKRKWGLNRLMGVTSEFTEMINRASVMYAVERNVMRDAKRKGGFRHWAEVDSMMNGELESGMKRQRKTLKEAAEYLGVRYSDESQFRYDSVHKANIQYHPLGMMLDQYNSFFRNWYHQVNAMRRRTFQAPEFKEAVKGLQGGDLRKMVKLMNDPNFTASEKGEFIKFAKDSVALTAGVGLLGGSLWTEFAFGGGPRFAENMNKVFEGIWAGDEDRFMDGLTGIFKTPAIENLWSVAEYGQAAISDAFGDPSTVKGSLSRLWTQRFMPTSRLETGYRALMAAATSKPQMVLDPKTGKPMYQIAPEDAMSAILFGSRSKTARERLNMLDERMRLINRQDNESKAQSRRFYGYVREMSGLGPDERGQYLARLMNSGKFETPDDVAAFRDAWKEMDLYHSDSMARGLQNLKPSLRAEMVHRMLEGKSKEDREAVVDQLLLTGALNMETMAEIAKLQRYPKASMFDGWSDFWSSVKEDFMSAIDDDGIEGGGIGLNQFVSGGSAKSKPLRAALGMAAVGITSTMRKALGKESMSHIPVRKEGLEAVLKTSKPYDKVEKMATDGLYGKISPQLGDKPFTIRMHSGEAQALNKSKFDSLAEFGYAMEKGDLEKASLHAKHLNIPFDVNRANTVAKALKGSPTSKAGAYISSIGYDSLKLDLGADRGHFAFELPLAGQMAFKEQQSKFLAGREAKIRSLSERNKLLSEGKAPLDNAMVQALGRQLRHRGIKRDLGDVFKGLNRYFANLGKMSYYGHNVYLMNDGLTVNRRELADYLKDSYRVIYADYSPYQLLEEADRILNDTVKTARRIKGTAEFRSSKE